MASADSSEILWKMRAGGRDFDRLAHRRAIGKFDGIDAGTVQDQRQEMPDAGLFIHHITERRAIRRERRRFDGQ